MSFYKSPLLFLVRRLVAYGFLTILLFIALLAVGSHPAIGSEFRPHIEADGASVSINEQTAFVVPGDDGASRAGSAARKLRRSGTKSLQAIKIKRRKWALETPSGNVIVFITRADARDEGTTVASLAESWADRANALFSIPPISLSGFRQPIILPTGGSRSFSVGGAAFSDQISARSNEPSVARTSFNPDNRSVTVQGLQSGETTIYVTADDGAGGLCRKGITVVDEDRAGNIDSDVDTTVTGSPSASPDVIVQSAKTALLRAVRLQSASYLEMIDRPRVYDSLLKGSSTTVYSTIRAVGADLYPVEQTVAIHVHNDSSYTARPAATLFYSNNPETVRQPQPLFTAVVPAIGQPVRLVYHHQNSTNNSLVIRVEILNVSQVETQLHIIRGMSVPAIDPVQAGTRAGTDFLREWRSNSGLTINLAAHTRLELVLQRIQPSEVASGVLEISQINGKAGTLYVRVDAETANIDNADAFSAIDSMYDPETAALKQVSLSDDYASQILSAPKSDQIYAAPTVLSVGTYTIGAHWLNLNIGTSDAVSRVTGSGSTLAGNYGVIYTFDITVTNPTSTPRKVAIDFESQAGAASGVFSFYGGSMESVNELYPPNDQQLAAVTVPANSTQTYQIQTIPLSGSAYPASIVAHAL